MSYLMIRNKGIVDIRSLTLVGASSTRMSNRVGTIGQFGSGSKLGIAKLLRDNIRPIVCASNLKAEFFSKPEHISGTTFNRIVAKLSGKDLDGKQTNRIEETSLTTEWGVQDWKHTWMAVREFVSNAIDGAIATGGSYKDVVYDVVDEPRAKADHTTVYIPYTPEIENVYRNLPKHFLHIGNPGLLNKNFLPKGDIKDRVVIYKNGVRVCVIPGESVYDYNFGNELTLDESRNATEWDIKYALAGVISRAKPEELQGLIRGCHENPNAWENKLDSGYFYASEESKKNLKTAFSSVFGDKAILMKNDSAPIVKMVEGKGFTPIAIGDGLSGFLEKAEVSTERDILSKSEADGKQVGEGSPDMVRSLDKIWNMCVDLNMSKGKTKPQLQSFFSLTENETDCLGYYTMGGNTVYIHRDLTAGPMLDQTMLEEIGHYITGATDCSRDFQNFFIRMIVAIAG